MQQRRKNCSTPRPLQAGMRGGHEYTCPGMAAARLGEPMGQLVHGACDTAFVSAPLPSVCAPPAAATGRGRAGGQESRGRLEHREQRACRRQRRRQRRHAGGGGGGTSEWQAGVAGCIEDAPNAFAGGCSGSRRAGEHARAAGLHGGSVVIGVLQAGLAGFGRLARKKHKGFGAPSGGPGRLSRPGRGGPTAGESRGCSWLAAALKLAGTRS